MKVCLFSSVHPCLDVRIFHKEARSLAQAGYQVTLVGVADFQEQVIDGIRALGLPQPASRALRPLNWYRVVKMALREKADLYHFHDPELLLVAPIIRFCTRKPIIYDVHENYPEDILTKEWIPAVLRRPFSALFRLFEDTMIRSVHGVVVVNDHLARRFQHKSQVVKVVNYSRPEQFAGQAPETATESAKPYFVYTGRISDDRGIYECAQAVVSLGDENVSLICAGRIGHVSNPEFRALLDGSHSAASFRFLGLLPFDDIPPLLKGAVAGLLCFLPTPNNLLGTPNKLFEYMSAGIPVIASDFPYLREVVSGTGCGLLVKPGDASEIATAMAQLLADPEDAKRKGMKGLQAARERYNWQVEEKKLLSLYDSLLANSPARG